MRFGKLYAEASESSAIRTAAETAAQVVEHWRNRKDRPSAVQLTLYDQLEEDT